MERGDLIIDMVERDGGAWYGRHFDVWRQTSARAEIDFEFEFDANSDK